MPNERSLAFTLMTLTASDLSPRQQEILDAARQLFSRQGYPAATMRDLARQLGLQPASLYSHYGAKEDMLWEIARRCADEFEAEVAVLADDAAPAPLRLARMIGAHLEVMVRNLDAAAIFLHEWIHLGEPHRSIYAARLRAYEAGFECVIAQGVAEGSFRPVHPRLIAHTLLAALNGIRHSYKSGQDLPPDLVQQQLTQWLLHGLAAGLPTPTPDR
ncbi:MAG: hypothetical protein OHK0039_15620 [Bacteroidia bacterium]